MAQTTAIEWTDLSWNPTHGCSKVSPGCAHCYAETLSLRYGQTPKAWTPENAAVNVLLKPHKLSEPLSNSKDWRGLGAAAAAAGKTDGKLVFVNSTSDLFHEQIPDEYVAKVFGVMAVAQRHTFQVLTKRPERMRALLTDPLWWAKVGDEVYALDGDPLLASALWSSFSNATWLANCWLGVSIENRKWVHRADVLRATPAAVRFISAEPLLGPLIDAPHPCHTCRYGPDGVGVGSVEPWGPARGTGGAMCPDCEGTGTAATSLDLTGIDWLICGGESGQKHRPMNVEWARDLRDACQARAIGDERPDTAFFMKQMGGSRPGTALEDLPADLRIREFPIAARETAVPAC